MSQRQQSQSGDEAAGPFCPECGTASVREEFSGCALFGFVFLWPFAPVRQRYLCEACGHTWKQFGW